MIYYLSKISLVESFWGMDDPDLEHLIIDAATVRAHLWAARKKGNKLEGEAGGIQHQDSIHVSVDGSGNPPKLRIAGGERNDMTQGEEWIENW
jgi:hypothetical protein